MSNGPVPSVLCSLSDLPSREVGDKVRFLGCITSYEFSTATLTLEPSSSGGGSVVAAVDVKLRLESLSAEQTEPGYWLNIIGYITSIAPLSLGGKSSRQSGHRVGIQSILHWPAVSVDPAMYEKHLKLQSTSAENHPACP